MTIVQTRPASRTFFPGNPPSGDDQEWIMRAANFVLVYNRAEAGDVLERVSDDEYFVYIPAGGATIEADGATMPCPAGGLAIVPPGPSRVLVTATSEIIRVFTAAAEDLAARAINASVYADGAAEVAPLLAWPAPTEGFALRVYRLAEFADKPMRMFRSTNIMLNIFDFEGPRDPEALSPHSHDDFEQGSFGATGVWVHSLRYPWSKKMSQWRDDEQLEIGSPSLLVIPAGVIHTSRATSDGRNQLVDIFSPPRHDFVEMGLVCNEHDYPPANRA